ncbi:hypothetical protein [Kitasatospora sp. NPDC017646]|uniref:hypothetical protein n=1 Tax=Kitasatospora sp. NPDC017646 TaxID=3364024 RepID=UPI0037A18FAF
MTGVRLLRGEDRHGAAQRAGRHGGHTGAARQDQWCAARHTLRTGLVRLGPVPDAPDAHRRIGPAEPGAVRPVGWDGAVLRPAVQFSVAHTAEQVVALRRLHPAADSASHRLTVEIAGADPPDHGPRRARVRTGTRTPAGRPPTAWAVAELPTRRTRNCRSAEPRNLPTR